MRDVRLKLKSFTETHKKKTSDDGLDPGLDWIPKESLNESLGENEIPDDRIGKSLCLTRQRCRFVLFAPDVLTVE